jgi:DNA processing protein
MIVVSGLAEGVDTAAHETALAEGGRTIAVIGTPRDGCFPVRNRSLQERIVREGLVISQFPLGAPIEKKNFPIRNRTMALLTDATVIVEAGESSGTLHQGWEALRLGRLLFLMQSVVEDTTLSWPAEMIRYGAQVLSRENLDIILDEMPSLTQVEPVAL